MKIQDQVAVVTGAGSGIGKATALGLVGLGLKGIAVVDRSSAVQEVASEIDARAGQHLAMPFIGDVTDSVFRRRTYAEISAHYGLVTICIPAAGISRDALAVRIDKETGHAVFYPEEWFKQVTEVNLTAPVYWALEMVARIAEDRFRRGIGRWQPPEEDQGVIIFIGSVSSQGNKGQIAYSATKRGIEGAARTLTTEAMFHGVRCAVIHPGFTDTPMVRALGQEFIDKNIVPHTQLRRLIRPEEIASAICFLITNPAVSGELWADAGWHPAG